MKIAVLGATGRAGRLVVDEALARGWGVRALARDPAKVAPRERLEVVRGEAKDAAAVDALVQGCDAVVSALGVVKGGPFDVCSEGTKNVLAAMKKHGVRRYVVVGGAASCAPGESKPLPGKLMRVAMGAFVGPLVRDKERELELLHASDVDWTVARPPVLKDGPKKGARTDPRGPPSLSLQYADLAAFVVDEIEARGFVRAAPYVSN